MKEITLDLNNNVTFYCSHNCQKIKLVFRVLGAYIFVTAMKLRYHVVSTIKVIVEFTENMSLTQSRDATANLSQARPNILPQNFLTGCFLYERIETQNLGKDQTLPAFPAVAALDLKAAGAPAMQFGR